MFLKLYEMNKAFFTSAAKRNSYYFYNCLNTHRKFKPLTLKTRWKAGRNDSGRIVIRTKGSLLIRQRLFKINYNFRYLKMGLLASFNFIPLKNKILSLIFFSNGAVTYYISNEDSKLFSMFFFNFHKKLKKFKFFKIHLMLIQIKKLSFVSCLEISPGKGAQYSRSSGTKSKIIKFDKDTHSALVQLPSGIKKVISHYSFALLGRVANATHSRCANGKAGYWRSFGIKSIVRGVAKNPVDHPHGGRTKAIKYPRTPWGKTTKFK